MDNAANTPPIKTNVIETGSGATVENIEDLDHDLDHDSKSASYLLKEAQELLSSPENIEDLDHVSKSASYLCKEAQEFLLSLHQLATHSKNIPAIPTIMAIAKEVNAKRLLISLFKHWQSDEEALAASCNAILLAIHSRSILLLSFFVAAGLRLDIGGVVRATINDAFSQFITVDSAVDLCDRLLMYSQGQTHAQRKIFSQICDLIKHPELLSKARSLLNEAGIPLPIIDCDNDDNIPIPGSKQATIRNIDIYKFVEFDARTEAAKRMSLNWTIRKGRDANEQAAIDERRITRLEKSKAEYAKAEAKNGDIFDDLLLWAGRIASYQQFEEQIGESLKKSFDNVQHFIQSKDAIIDKFEKIGDQNNISVDITHFEAAIHQAGIKAFGEEFRTQLWRDNSDYETNGLGSVVADRKEVMDDEREPEEDENGEEENVGTKRKRSSSKKSRSPATDPEEAPAEQEPEQQLEPLPQGVETIVSQSTQVRKVLKRTKKPRYHRPGEILAPLNDAFLTIVVKKGQGVQVGPFEKDVVVFAKVDAPAVVRFDQHQQEVSKFPVIIPAGIEFGVVCTDRSVNVFVSPYVPEALVPHGGPALDAGGDDDDDDGGGGGNNDAEITPVATQTPSTRPATRAATAAVHNVALTTHVDHVNGNDREGPGTQPGPPTVTEGGTG